MPGVLALLLIKSSATEPAGAVAALRVSLRSAFRSKSNAEFYSPFATTVVFTNLGLPRLPSGVLPTTDSRRAPLGWRPVFLAVAATYAPCASSWLFIDCTIPVIGPPKPAADAP